MSSNTTASSPGFDQARGRSHGYRPDQVDRFLETTEDGYRSRAEFVKVAIREKLEKELVKV